MYHMNLNESNIQTQTELLPTFTEVFSIWFFFTLGLEIVFYFLLGLFFPLSEQGMTVGEVIIIRILILLNIPIFTLPIILIQPYQKIDWSQKGLMRSFYHKLFFLLTSPLLLAGLFIDTLILKYYLPALYIQGLRDYSLALLFWLFHF